MSLEASVKLATETAEKFTVPIIMAALSEVEERNDSHTQSQGGNFK